LVGVKVGAFVGVTVGFSVAVGSNPDLFCVGVADAQ
jgi:hypothetical protein